LYIIFEIQERIFMNYDIILFDADETLLDFKKSEHEALLATFRRYGVNADEALLQLYAKTNHGLWEAFERGEVTKQDILNRRFRETFQAAGITGSFEGLEEFYQTELSKGSYKIEGAEELCRRLAKSCRLYLVTNGVASTQRRRMKESGLEVYFRDLFISEEAGCQKPQKEFFDYMAARIPDYDRSRALIVGDSLTSDIAGGRGAGIATCWYCRNGRAEDGEGKADYIIRDLREVYLIVGDEKNE
jgi:2-haloacid dehalogenase